MKKILIYLVLSLITPLSFAESDSDPFEDINRTTYQFNQTLDKNILKPVAKTYQENVPKTVQAGVSNFFGNLGDISTLFNQILQFKPTESVTTFGRVVVNTTIGLGGIFDVASNISLTTKNEDFGQTMAVWGIGNGPYLVLPILGPSTLRDGVGIAVDLNGPGNATRELNFINSISVGIIDVVNTRAKLSSVIDFVNQTDDPYTTTRSAYLQKRKFNINDGIIYPDDEF